MKFFQKSIKIKLIISTFFIVIVATMLVSLGIYSSVLSDLQKSMGQRLQHVAATASLLVNASDHKKVYLMWLKSVVKQQGTIADIEKSEEFLSIQKTLRDIKNINNLQQDIYTVVLPKFLKKQKQMVFMTMSKDKPYIGNSLPISEIAKKVQDEKKPAYSDIYVDHEGKWISALAPIIQIKKGKEKVVGLIEVDYDVTEEVHAVQMNLLKKALLWSTVGMLLSLVITMIISNALSKPIINLSEHTKKPIDDNWTSTLTINRPDEIGALAESMRVMVNEIVVSRKQLEDYAHNLEEKVKARTKELNDMNIKLKTILDSLGQGLFLFNPDGSIDPLYSKITDSFLAKPLDEMNAKEFYIEKFEVERTFNVLFNEIIPFDDAVGLLPDKINQVSEDIFLDINYKTIRNEDGIDKVLVVITDKTFEIINERRFKQKETETNRLMSIYTSQNELKSFISDAKQRIRHSKEILKNNEVDLVEIKRHAHTIKGGASWFYAEKTFKTSTEIETICTKLESDDPDIVIDKNDALIEIKNLYNDLEVNLKDFIAFASETLDYDVEGKDMINLEEEKIINIINKMDNAQEIVFNDLLCLDADDLLKGFNRLALDTAKNLHKEISPIKITSDGTRLYRNHYKAFLDTIVHYIRNMIDHGIETPKERKKQEKDSKGNISFHLAKNEDKIIFEFIDDGSGIDLEAVKEKSKELKVDVSNLSDYDIAQLVFLPSLTTKSSKSDLSGLGVGMEVIKTTVESMNGNIEIITKNGKGSTLKVELPYLEFKDIKNATV